MKFPPRFSETFGEQLVNSVLAADEAATTTDSCEELRNAWLATIRPGLKYLARRDV